MLCCMLLSACDVELPPIESCFIEDAALGPGAPKTEVSPTQLKPLSEWFASVSHDWKFEAVDVPPSGLVFVLKDNKGRVTRANLRGDYLWIRNRFKVLTPAERGELLVIVAKNQLPVFIE